MKTRVVALLGALVLTAWAATSAFAAAPPGTVTVNANGCTFTVAINLDQAYDVVAWKVKEYNAVNWKDGTTLIKGSSENAPDGDILAGPYTLPEGHYNVVVDNEATIDGSAIVVDFVLSCPTESGTELPAEGSQPPSKAPGGVEEGAAGTPRGGGVLALTPPPTDVTAAPVASQPDGARAVILAIAAIIGALVASAVIRRPADQRARRRGR
jgi:hypothetical protein